MLELRTGDFKDNLPRLPLQGTTALPSLRKGCASIAVLPRIIRASDHGGSLVMAILEDFKKVFTLGIAKRGQKQIVEDEDVDLAGAENVEASHIAEAIQYRSLDRRM